MPKLKASEEFVVGKHNIGYVSSDFKSEFKDTEFELSATPTFQKLPRAMNDVVIESELKPGLCTVGDILAFIDNPPEGTKDDYSNLFYTKSFVVGVYWGSGSGMWSVHAYRRDGYEWGSDGRVFSPVTENSGPKNFDLESFDALKLECIKDMQQVTAIAVSSSDGEYLFMDQRWYKKI